MAVTYAADLASISPEVWTDLIIQSLGNSSILTNLAVRHDGNVQPGSVYHFPSIGSFTAHRPAADTEATTYNTITPADSSADVFEVYKAIALSRHAQNTTAVTSVMMLAQSIADSVAREIENALVDEAATNASAEVGTTATAFSAALALEARAELGANANLMQGWILNATAEGSLLSDLADASAWGGAAVLVEGSVARLLGAPVYVSPNLAVNTSVLIPQNSLHYVAFTVERDVVYDPDIRADKLMVRTDAAVKLVETPGVPAVRILHT